jgi:hypothetical protein
MKQDNNDRRIAYEALQAEVKLERNQKQAAQREVEALQAEKTKLQFHYDMLLDNYNGLRERIYEA